MKTNHEIILLKTFLWLLIDSVMKFRYPIRKLPSSMGSALLQIEPMSPALAVGIHPLYHQGHPPFLFHMACYKYLCLWHLSCWHLFPALESEHWGHKDFVFISPNPNPYLTQLNNETKTFLSVYYGTGTLRHCWWTFSCCHHFVVVQSLSCVQLFVTPWTAACQASLSFIISWSLLKLMCQF